MEIIKEVINSINLCEIESQNSNSEYFKAITKVLEQMKNCLISGDLNLKQQELYSAGLTKIVLDNYSFAMSKLGLSLLKISDEYAKYKTN